MPELDDAQFLAEVLEASERLRLWFRKRVASEHDADDLVQDALLELWKSRLSFRSNSTLAAWSYGIGVHVLCRYYRAQGRRPTELGQDEQADYRYQADAPGVWTGCAWN